MMKKFSKRIAAFACAAVMTASCAVGAFAATPRSNYFLGGTTTAEGAFIWLTSAQKEYTDVDVSGPNGSTARVSLYDFNGGYWGNDQDLTPGSGRRAWWYGGGDNLYQIQMRVLLAGGQTMTLNGTFQNVR